MNATASNGRITHFGISYFGLQHRQVSKSTFTAEYRVFCELLRELRIKKGVTQTALSAALGMAQSFVSKYEMGERRLDFVEVHRLCDELGVDLEKFAKAYVNALGNSGRKGQRKGGVE